MTEKNAYEGNILNLHVVFDISPELRDTCLQVIGAMPGARHEKSAELKPLRQMDLGGEKEIGERGGEEALESERQSGKKSAEVKAESAAISESRVNGNSYERLMSQASDLAAQCLMRSRDGEKTVKELLPEGVKRVSSLSPAQLEKFTASLKERCISQHESAY